MSENYSNQNTESQEKFNLGHTHSFQTGIAINLGLHAAIVFNHIVYWLNQNAGKKDANIIDGKVWMYETQQEMSDFFGYLSVDEVQKAIRKLLESGLLIKGNHSKNAFDRRNWYTVSDQNLISNKVYETANRRNGERHTASSDSANRRNVYNNKETQEEHNKKEREGASPLPPPSQEEIFSFGRVKILNHLREKLIQDFGASKVQEYVEKLNEFADINPKRFRAYANHATVVRKWIREDIERKKTQYAQKPSKHTGISAKSYDEKIDYDFSSGGQS